MQCRTISFFFFFDGTRVWTQGFVLAKQMLYCLSHSSSPFFSGYFGDKGLEDYLPRLVLNLDPPDLSLLSTWDYRHEPPMHSEQDNLTDEETESCMALWWVARLELEGRPPGYFYPNWQRTIFQLPVIVHSCLKSVRNDTEHLSSTYLVLWLDYAPPKVHV
jgi:hypothetical protein